jgi:phosphoesterase RecJ-like protein
MNKETSSIIKEKAPLILAEIQKAETILLHCHPSPDPDSVGSALAMKSVLEGMGKKATVIQGDSEMPQAFMHFPGAKDIVKKNFTEVDLKGFDLFIALDSGGLNMISSRTKEIVFPESLSVVMIDHHASNKGYGRIQLLDTASPATSFILFQLFHEWDIRLTPEIALNLLMGMYFDTGGFKYPPTDYRVLEAAAICAKMAPEFTEAVFIVENSETRTSIYFQALALNSVKTYCHDSVAIASVSSADLRSKDIKEQDMRGDLVSNMLKSVMGWNIAVTMIEKEPNIIKLNFRTRDSGRFDVSKAASALGGGGHRAAAGACLRASMDEAMELVVAKIKELYNL